MSNLVEEMLLAVDEDKDEWDINEQKVLENMDYYQQQVVRHRIDRPKQNDRYVLLDKSFVLLLLAYIVHQMIIEVAVVKNE